MNTEIEFTTVLPDNFSQAFNLVTETFVADSGLHKALGTTLEEYRSYLYPAFKNMVFDYPSVVALEKRTQRIVGCVVTTDYISSLKAPLTNTRFAPVQSLGKALHSLYAQQQNLSAGDGLLVDMAVVSEDFRSKGIYQEMRRITHQEAKSAGFDYVLGELSSAATQNVVLKTFGHKNVAEIAPASFVYDGTYPFANIIVPAKIILAEGSL